MSYEAFLYLGPYIISLILSLGVFIYAWQHRHVRGATSYSWFAGGQTLTILGFIFELVSPTLESKIIWDKFQWLTDTFLVILPFLFFSFEFSEYKLRHPSVVWSALFVFLGTFSVLLFTDNFHHLLYPNPTLGSGYPFPELKYDFTYVVYIYALVYIYGANFYGLGLLFKRALQPHNLYRLQYVTIIFGFLIPLVLSFFPLANIKLASQRDITPLSLAIGNLIVAWGLFRYGLFDIVPIARDRIVENINDPVIVLDPKNRIVDINKAATAFLNKRSSELIGQASELVFAKWPLVIELLNDTHNSKREFSTKSKNDTLFFDINISSILTRRQNLLGRILVARDITRHKNLETNYKMLSQELEQRVLERTEELHKSVERYRAVVENQTEFIVRWKPDRTRTFVNEAYCRNFALTLEQAMQIDFMTLIPEEDRKPVEEKIARLILGVSEVETEIHRVIGPDGSTSWQEWTDRAIKDGTGKVVELQSVGRDITERKQAEKALRESESIYRQAIEVAGAVPYRQSYGEGFITNFDFIGEGISQLTGYGPEEFNEDLWDSLVQETNLLGELTKYSWREAIQHVRTGANPIWQCEHRIQTRNGDTRWVHEAAVELRDKDGKSHGSIGLFQDITERKQSEETILNQLAFDDLMTRLLTDFATCSHNDVDTSIRNALKEIAIFFKGDFSDILLLSEDKTSWNMTHYWMSPQLPQSTHPTSRIQTGALVWSENKLLKGEAIKINSLEDYPSEAAADRQFSEAEGVKSLFSVPIRGREQSSVGVIDVVAYTHYTAWTDSDVTHLKLIGDAIANLLERKKAEDALRQSEERFSKAFQASPTIITITQLSNGKLLEVNEAFENIMGYTRAEVLGKTTVELGIWRDKSDRDSITELVRRNGQLKNAELQFRTKSGPYITCYYSAEIIDLEGEKCLLSTIEDITERKKSELRILNLNRLYVTISQINQTIVHARDKDSLFREICRVAIDHGQFRMAWIGLLDENDVRIDPIMFAGAELGYLKNLEIKYRDMTTGSGPTGTAVREGQCIICQDIASDSRMTPWREPALERGYRSSAAVPIREQGHVIGALTVYASEPFAFDTDDKELLEQIGQDVSFALDSIHAEIKRERAEANLAEAYDTTLEGWAKALELRDKETEGHSRRVTETTLVVARSMGLSEEELIHIRRGSILHDIGKMGIPDDILRKAGPLTEEERQIVLKHPDTAYDLLKQITYLEKALEIPHCHHEKWDGTGYPRKLKGEEIPLSARIFAIVDVWDALSSDRPYREAWPKEKVIQYLINDSGKHFDPRVLHVFVALVEKGEI